MCVWHPRERGNDPNLKRDGKKQRKEILEKKKTPISLSVRRHSLCPNNHHAEEKKEEDEKVDEEIMLRYAKRTRP